MIKIPETKMTRLDCAFGNIKHLPKWEDIPQEFKEHNSDNKWLKAQSDWFSKGIKFSSLIPKKGIDKQQALSILSAIQSSWKPKHEHKAAGVAYLMSEWFSDYKG